MIVAWSTWGTYVYLAVAQNKARILLDGQGLMSGLSYEVATERAIAEKRDLLRTFSDRLQKALRWGLANVDAYAAAWASETGVTYEVSRQTLLARGFTPAPIDPRTIVDQQHTVDVYFQQGVLPLPGLISHSTCIYRITKLTHVTQTCDRRHDSVRDQLGLTLEEQTMSATTAELNYIVPTRDPVRTGPAVQHMAKWDYFLQTRSGYRVTIKGDRP